MPHDIEKSLHCLKSLGFAKDDFCIAGSAALYLLSKPLIADNKEPLIKRSPNDVDVLCVKSVFDRARQLDGFITTLNEKGDCLSLKNGDIAIELATYWPGSGIQAHKADDIRDISVDMGDFNVMRVNFVAALKFTLGRAKDLADLEQIDKALGLMRSRKTQEIQPE
ncbi:MAG: hypothetical protein ACK4NR_07110 [Micavibrio sp.]